MNDKSCIIVPCYNEAERLRPAEFLRYLEEIPGMDFCFVNDGSMDGTLRLLESLRSKDPGRLHIVDLEANAGKGEAVRAGMNHVLSLGRYGIVGYMDADLSAPGEEMERLSAMLSSDDELVAVIGSRRKTVGSVIRRKAFRHYPGRMFAASVRTLYGMKIYDTQCGAKVFRADLAGKVFADPFISRWLFDIELLLRIKRACPDGLSGIREEPLAVWVDGGDSRIKTSDLFRLPGELMRIKRRYRRRR